MLVGKSNSRSKVEVRTEEIQKWSIGVGRTGDGTLNNKRGMKKA